MDENYDQEPEDDDEEDEPETVDRIIDVESPYISEWEFPFYESKLSLRIAEGF